MNNIIKISNGFSIPNNFIKSENYNDIISELRLKGFITINRRGFDIIRNKFFIEETLSYYRYYYDDEDNICICNKKTAIEHYGLEHYELYFRSLVLPLRLYDDFDDYYNYLNGDIYNNSCYFMYKFSDELIKKYNIDLDRINFRSFIDKTLKDDIREKEEFKYDTEFIELSNDIDYLDSFCYGLLVNSNVWNFEFSDKQNFLLYKWFNTDTNISYIEKIKVYKFNNRQNYAVGYLICKFLFNIDLINEIEIKENIFKVRYPNLSREELENSKGLRKKVILDILNLDKIESVFYYLFVDNKKSFSHKDLLENLKEVCTSKCYHLSQLRFKSNLLVFENCYKIKFKDYSNNICNFIYDIKEVQCINIKDITETNTYINLRKYWGSIPEEIYKLGELKDGNIWFNNKIRVSLPVKTNVNKSYYNKYNVVFRDIETEFDFFCDFVYYLNNDISGANLLDLEDNIKFLKDSDIIYDNIITTYNMKQYLGLQVEDKEFIRYDNNLTKNLDLNYENNIKSNNELVVDYNDTNNIIAFNGKPFDEFHDGCKRINYISDLHLMHKLKDCKIKDDYELKIRNFLSDIDFSCGITIFDGDTCTSFEVFSLFLFWLNFYSHGLIIFILGNHEFWEYDNVDNCIEKYKELIESYDGMILLQNEVLGISRGKYRRYSIDDIKNSNIEKNNLYILGGVGFAGKNTIFNANNFIYLNCINRDEEIKQSLIFEDLYNECLNKLDANKLICVTHFPKRDWHSNNLYDKNVTYIEGHTHNNYFINQDNIRVFGNNQIGYKDNFDDIYFKTILADVRIDIFEDYDDGIYEITTEQYKDFYYKSGIDSLNIEPLYKLYLLKNLGYYMFISISKSGSYSIMNKGSKKKLDSRKGKNLEYYFNNMPRVISKLDTSVLKYFQYQQNIAENIKNLGGQGTIHGCIVDIDFFNHVYVNPLDMTLMYYYAYNIVDKKVYPNINSLIQHKCTELSLVSEDSILNNVSEGTKNLPVNGTYYSDTKMYKMNSVMNKMQKLRFNILTVWLEDIEVLLETNK